MSFNEVISIIAMLLSMCSLAASAFLVWIEHRRDQERRDQQRRSEASLMQAYVARFPTSEAPDRWGFVIINAAASSLTNLTVWTRSKTDPLRNSNGDLPTAGRYLTVPPGRYFVARNIPHEKYAWAFPEALADHDLPQPIMNTQDWMVEKFEFADANGQCWRRTYDAAAVETGELRAIEGKDLTRPAYWRRT